VVEDGSLECEETGMRKRVVKVLHRPANDGVYSPNIMH
jgi:hypothetical protein